MIGEIMGGPKLIKFVRPHYPNWARRRHIEGTVELAATISKDGRVRDLRFVKGPKALAPYAEDAVRKWRYQPFELNGTPVEVKTDIMVPFIASRSK
jgi:protein TonB